MSAAAVAVVATSGERHEGKAGVVKLCDPRLSALSVPWCKKALYKYSSFPFLSFPLNLNGCVLAALLHGSLVAGVSQTLRR